MSVIDHRKLGRELGLFASDELLGAGLPMWLPAGAAVRAELEKFVVELERRNGYHHVYTPPLAKRELYERSGHWQHFRDGMFPPIDMGGDELVLRPMNCPHHMRVFAQGERSYRELPLRIAELGAMFRNELSGALGGLSRVRGMTLNDGHVFCAEEQIDDELDRVIAMMRHAHAVLGVDVHRYRLSLGGEGGKFATDPAAWEASERALRGSLSRAGIEFDAEHGEAAFYGPKVDVQVVDPAGREETLATLQVDRVLPGRLGIAFVAADGSDQTPVVIHRSLISTMERMVAYLIERYDGALPMWLSPIQVAVVPVSEASESHAQDVMQRLVSSDLRAQLLSARHTLNARIREAAAAKIPYVAVVGDREAAADGVAARGRDGRSADMSVDAFIAMLAKASRDRAA